MFPSLLLDPMDCSLDSNVLDILNRPIPESYLKNESAEPIHNDLMALFCNYMITNGILLILEQQHELDNGGRASFRPYSLEYGKFAEIKYRHVNNWDTFIAKANEYAKKMVE